MNHIIEPRSIPFNVPKMMASLKSTLLLAFLLYISLSTFAQNDSEDPCEGVQNQLNMNLCAAQKYKAADAELNKIWKELKPEAGWPKDADVLVAQRIWIKYRDAHCDCLGNMFEGGSIAPMIMSNCLRKLTEERTAHLKSILEWTDM